jgi:hypothetical protein
LCAAILAALYLGLSFAVYKAATGWMGATEQAWGLFGAPFTPLHAGWQAIVCLVGGISCVVGWIYIGALAIEILCLPAKLLGKRSGVFYAVVIAAVLGSGAILLANRYQFTPMNNDGRLAVCDRLTGSVAITELGLKPSQGAKPSELGETHTVTYEGRRTELQSYWKNGKMHYRGRRKITAEQFARAVAAPAASGAQDERIGLVFSLQNRFGEELVRISIPAAHLQREKDEPEWVAAAGSVTLAADDYLEAKTSVRGWALNHLED